MYPEWRNRIALVVAVSAWLAAWYAGWLTGGVLVPGSWTYATFGSVVGWFVGLGLAVLVLFLNERI